MIPTCDKLAFRLGKQAAHRMRQPMPELGDFDKSMYEDWTGYPPQLFPAYLQAAARYKLLRDEEGNLYYPHGAPVGRLMQQERGVLQESPSTWFDPASERAKSEETKQKLMSLYFEGPQDKQMANLAATGFTPLNADRYGNILLDRAGQKYWWFKEQNRIYPTFTPSFQKTFTKPMPS